MKITVTLLATTLMSPLFALAMPSNYLCGSMAHAEQTVQQQFNLSPSDASVQALFGADESLAGGQYVYRKIVVRVQSAHSASNRDLVVSYTIVKSYDGPDNGNYCTQNGVETKQDVCKARPDLEICH